MEIGGWQIIQSKYTPPPFSNVGNCVYVISPVKLSKDLYFGFWLYKGMGNLIDTYPVPISPGSDADIHKRVLITNLSYIGNRIRCKIFEQLFEGGITTETIKFAIERYEEVDPKTVFVNL